MAYVSPALTHPSCLARPDHPRRADRRSSEQRLRPAAAGSGAGPPAGAPRA